MHLLHLYFQCFASMPCYTSVAIKNYSQITYTVWEGRETRGAYNKTSYHVPLTHLLYLKAAAYRLS